MKKVKLLLFSFLSLGLPAFSHQPDSTQYNHITTEELFDIEPIVMKSRLLLHVGGGAVFSPGLVVNPYLQYNFDDINYVTFGHTRGTRFVPNLPDDYDAFLFPPSEKFQLFDLNFGKRISSKANNVWRAELGLLAGKTDDSKFVESGPCDPSIPFVGWVCLFSSNYNRLQRRVPTYGVHSKIKWVSDVSKSFGVELSSTLVITTQISYVGFHLGLNFGLLKSKK
ncbi:MAG: hypothetical protein R2788_12070 [Saprospiraceae bacterium]